MNKSKILILAGVLALLAAVPVQAQNFIYHLAGGTNNVPALSTNNPGGQIATGVGTPFIAIAPRGGNLGIQLSFRPETSGSLSNVLLKIDRSIDGANFTRWEQNIASLSVAGTSGVVTNTVCTNLVVGGLSYFRLWVANTNTAGAFTNVWLVTDFKPGL